MEKNRLGTHHILVVDDEPDVESLISQKFRREIRSGNYRFTFAGNGAEAFEKVTTIADFDMVLTDINMPVMDGLTLISKLNTLEHPPKTVVVSAYGDINNIRVAMNNGAFDFVTKPINFQDLAATLKKTLTVVTQDKDRQAQLDQAKIKMVQNEKMSSLGQMVAGVAHEINNPVNFIYGNLKPAKNYFDDLLRLIQCYQRVYPEPVADIQDCMEEIDLDFVQTDLASLFESLALGASRIRDLVLSLRNFSRLDESEKKAVDIHEGIDSTLLLLTHRFKATSERSQIQIVREYGSLPLVSCYPSQLNQVVMNLLANAIDALEEHSLEKTAQGETEIPGIIQIRTEATEEERVSITIIDNGPGMGESTIAKLFEPFFTTKPVGQGTGLGLSISHQIIEERHGGKLSCQSRLGAGTQFVIDLPM
ncbi:MAG: ATP-binding protein [Cyanobacteria bacterium P01_A01_bin.116]